MSEPAKQATSKSTNLSRVVVGQPPKEKIGAHQLSIIVPCFNEGGAIGTTLEQLVKSYPDAETIVVDDGSSDNSLQEIERHPTVHLIVHPKNLGQGSSLRTGCLSASREFVLWYDADGQHSPDMIEAVLDEIAACDCVIGSRSRTSFSELSRRPGKLILFFLIRVLTGYAVPDMNSGFRAFRISVLRRYLHLLPPRFSASSITTLLMMERGYRLKWVPITTKKRVGTSSVSQLRDGFAAIFLVLRLVQLFSPLRVFIPVSLALIVGGGVYGLIRAIVDGQGIPALAITLMIGGLQIFLFGLLADQISALRKEKFEIVRPR